MKRMLLAASMTLVMFAAPNSQVLAGHSAGMYSTSQDLSDPKPLAGATFGGIVYLTVSTDQDTTRVRFDLDGTTLGKDDTAPFSQPLDTTLYAEGAHSFDIGVQHGGGTWTVHKYSVTFLQQSETPQKVNSIGYIGCSNTWMSAVGYERISDKDLMWPQYNTGQGHISFWANPNHNLWDLFDRQVAKFGPPKRVFVQVCLASPSVPYERVPEALAILRGRVDVPVDIAGINSYDPADLNDIPWKQAQEYAGRAVSDGLASGGPLLGPLTAETTKDDNVHPTDPEGMAILGQQLVDFYDA